MKRVILVCILSFAFIVLAADMPAAKPVPATPAEKEFTLEELAKFDGKEGRPAYVAIHGIVYDVTGVKAWSSGSHKGGTPGTDITPLIGKSPHGSHGEKVTKNLKPVGRLKK